MVGNGVIVTNTYVLVTPAQNEEALIEKTIQTVINQTILPRMWVIVSDASTDRTDEIVNQYAAKYDFIKFGRIEKRRQRDFSSKVDAFNVGYNMLKSMEFDFLGNLDADVSFNPFYYERILQKFKNNKNLGIAGGVRYDWHNGRFVKVPCARNSVGGPFQLFRRQCYETIGGFLPLKLGGEDAVAEITARMHGWIVESFPEIKVYHHRATGTAMRSLLRASFFDGIKYYVIGYHPLFQTMRCVYRCKQKPFILRSLLTLCGYFWAFAQRYEKSVPKDVLNYFRREQIARLKSLLFITS